MFSFHDDDDDDDVFVCVASSSCTEMCDVQCVV